MIFVSRFSSPTNSDVFPSASMHAPAHASMSVHACLQRVPAGSGVLDVGKFSKLEALLHKSEIYTKFLTEQLVRPPCH